MDEQKEKRPLGMTWRPILIAAVSYFGIKYGIAAQFFELSELRFFYSLALFIGCTYFARVADQAWRERGEK